MTNKIFVFCLIITISLSSLQSINAEGTSSSPYDGKWIAKYWTVDGKPHSLTFNDDGSGSFLIPVSQYSECNISSITVKFTYTYSGDSIKLTNQKPTSNNCEGVSWSIYDLEYDDDKKRIILRDGKLFFSFYQE